MSFTQLFYHIVFATKNREPLISSEKERRVYTLLLSVMTKLGAQVYRIGGMPDHVHIFTSVPPEMPLSHFVKELKRATSVAIRNERIISGWPGWQEGYGAFSYSIHDREKIVNYIRNQKEHHRHISFIEEYRQWLLENGVPESELRFIR